MNGPGSDLSSEVRAETRTSWKAIVMVTSVAAAIAVCGGCSQPMPRRPIRVLIGWDTSGSNRTRLPEDTRLGIQLIRALDADRDTIKLFRVDRDVQEFFDQKPPESRETLDQLLIQQLRSPAQKRLTRPAKFWKEILPDVRKSQEPVLVVLLTDGENDDQSLPALREFHQAIADLARCLNLQRVCIWGVENETRHTLRQDLAPFGDRLSIHGFPDASIPEALTLIHSDPVVSIQGKDADHHN